MNPEFLIREASEADFESIKLLQPEGWRDITPNIAFYFQHPNQCTLFVVEAWGKIIGCGAVIRHAQSAWLGHIIVSPNHRGKGLGQTITKHLLQHASLFTGNIRLIATRMGHPVYNRLGFVSDGAYRFFTAGQSPAYPPVSPNIKRYQPAHHQHLLALDEDTTGEQREWLLGPLLTDAWVYENNGQVQGFTLPALGEGLTLATTAEAGIALMMITLKQNGRIALPEENLPAIEAVLNAGYQEIPEAYGVKMGYGRNQPWKPAQTYGRIAGNLG